MAALFAFAECDEEHCVNPFDLFNLYVQGLCVLDENAAADIRSIISGFDEARVGMARREQFDLGVTIVSSVRCSSQ